VSVCHRTRGAQAFVPISVADAALDAHMAHGDGLVGYLVPEQPRMTFGADCTAVATDPSAAPIFNFASMGCYGGTVETPGFGTIAYREEGSQIVADVHFVNGPPSTTLPLIAIATGGDGCWGFNLGSITTDASGSGTATVSFDIGNRTNYWVAIDGGLTQWGTVVIPAGS
jgi:hypothetical protein